ncbi:hypothetical protein HK405_000486 [Cladochytrium tenue]|nr:hypothetical protein HK405_000486 [Cladochytrium tenue]
MRAFVAVLAAVVASAVSVAAATEGADAAAVAKWGLHDGATNIFQGDESVAGNPAGALQQSSALAKTASTQGGPPPSNRKASVQLAAAQAASAPLLPSVAASHQQSAALAAFGASGSSSKLGDTAATSGSPAKFSGGFADVLSTRLRFHDQHSAASLVDALAGVLAATRTTDPTKWNKDATKTFRSADIVPSATSDPFSDGTVSSITGQITHLNVYTGIGGAILIATGIALLFWGHRIFKLVLFLSGFYVFGILTYVILQFIAYKTGSDFGGGDHRDLVYLISCIVIGLLGGLLFMCFWRLGMSAIGALLGFVLATFILSFVSGGTISSGIGRSVFIILMSAAGAILIIFVERPVLILGTATTGAFAVITGIDIFVSTGFTDAVHTFLSGSGSFSVTWKTGLMLGAFFLLALIGVVFQFRSGKHHHPRKDGARGVPTDDVEKR